MNISNIPKQALINKRLHIIGRLEILCNLINANDKVLDIGCGTGSYITEALGYLPVKITAIDYDYKSIEYAKLHNHHKRVEYIKAEGETFTSLKKYDVIICSHVIEHSINPESLISNIQSLLGDDGILFLALPNGYGCFELENIIPRAFNFTEFGGNILNKLMSMNLKDSLNHDSWHVNYFTIKRLIKLLTLCGLKVNKIYNEQVIGGVVTDRTLLKIPKMEEFNLKIADKLPHFLANGWILICQKN
jgi:2-polyprenyl-3-methyl-5-hydroxy-6-metoxy-1,4-benzoquinol methylase